MGEHYYHDAANTTLYRYSIRRDVLQHGKTDKTYDGVRISGSMTTVKPIEQVDHKALLGEVFHDEPDDAERLYLGTVRSGVNGDEVDEQEYEKQFAVYAPTACAAYLARKKS